MKQMIARATKSAHVGTAAYGLFHAAQLELARWNADDAASFARSFIEIANEHQLATYTPYSVWFDGWLEWRLGNRDAGLSGMRNGRARLAEASLVYPVSLYETILAEAEAEAGETDAALATIDRAIAESERTGQRWYEAESHRVRGEILLQSKTPPAAPRRRGVLPHRHRRCAGSESPQLRTARRALAREALSREAAATPTGTSRSGRRWKGFRQRRSFPRSRRRRGCSRRWRRRTGYRKPTPHAAHNGLKLQASYGQAVMYAKGYTAAETKTAFARAGELATDIGSGADSRAKRPIMLGSAVVCFAASLGRPGKRPKTSFAKAEREAGPTDGGCRASRFRDWLSSSKAISAQARAHYCEQTRCEFTIPSEITKPSFTSVRT